MTFSQLAEADGIQDVTLVTGFPSYTARRMIDRLLANPRHERIYVLVRHVDAADADDYLMALDEAHRRHVQVLVGDVTNMDLGLSGREYRLLTKEVTCIHHMAARYHLGHSKDEVQQVNVGGTRGAIELALEANRLRRFVFWSTAHVSGQREGVVMEDELQVGQIFRNCYEHSKYAAEKIVRSLSRRVPATVLRPSLIVGDSKSGEIGRYDGPYSFIAVLMNSQFEVQLPLSNSGVGPLNIIPIDYLVDAAYVLSRVEATVSKTFHVVDPAPLSVKSVYDLVADQARRRVARGAVPNMIAKAVKRIPWVGRLKKSSADSC